MLLVVVVEEASSVSPILVAAMLTTDAVDLAGGVSSPFEAEVAAKLLDTVGVKVAAGLASVGAEEAAGRATIGVVVAAKLATVVEVAAWLASVVAEVAAGLASVGVEIGARQATVRAEVAAVLLTTALAASVLPVIDEGRALLIAESTEEVELFRALRVKLSAIFTLREGCTYSCIKFVHPDVVLVLMGSGLGRVGEEEDSAPGLVPGIKEIRKPCNF